MQGDIGSGRESFFDDLREPACGPVIFNDALDLCVRVLLQWWDIIVISNAVYFDMEKYDFRCRMFCFWGKL